MGRAFSLPFDILLYLSQQPGLFVHGLLHYWHWSHWCAKHIPNLRGGEQCAWIRRLRIGTSCIANPKGTRNQKP